MAITATTPEVCTCCKPCVDGTLACRTRGGTASLCGFSEFSSPSSPPKKYRKNVFSGTDASEQYSDAACSAVIPDSAISCTHDYMCQYDKDDCSLVISGTGVICNGSTVAGPSCVGAPVSTTPACDTNATIGRISFSFSPSSNCCAISGAWEKSTSDDRVATLSDEDSDGDAIARLLAGAGGTWSSYSGSGGGECLAQWEVRTTGFDIHYLEAQYRVEASGLTPGGSYSVIVDIYRRVYGVGSYTLFETRTLAGTADGSGHLQIDGDVPNDQGYQTYAVVGACPS